MLLQYRSASRAFILIAIFPPIDETRRRTLMLDRSELKRDLQALPSRLSIAVAVRAAMRGLPTVAPYLQRQRSRQFLVSVFRAYSCTVASSAGVQVDASILISAANACTR